MPISRKEEMHLPEHTHSMSGKLYSLSHSLSLYPLEAQMEIVLGDQIAGYESKRLERNKSCAFTEYIIYLV
jgi:hypothetical protein